MPSLVSRGLHCLSYFRRFPDWLEAPVVYLADYIAQTFRYAGHIDADSGAGRAQKIEAHKINKVPTMLFQSEQFPLGKMLRFESQ